MTLVHLGQQVGGESTPSDEPQEPVRVVACRPDVTQGKAFEGLFRDWEPEGGRACSTAQQWVGERFGHPVEVVAGDGQEECGVLFVRVAGVEDPVEGFVGVRA